MPFFSIIVPIYNVERYLPYCLNSIRKQTFSDFEVICVNDGSLDYSKEIAQAYADFDPRFKLLDKINGGLSSARNAGIRAASGDYLMFVDSDDFIEESACATLYDVFTKQLCDVVTFGANCVPVCDSVEWLQNCLSPQDAVYEGFDPDLIFGESTQPYVWRTSIKRTFLAENKIYFRENIKFGEDAVFFFELYPQSSKTCVISNKLYNYRPVRKNSLMFNFTDGLECKLQVHLCVVEEILKIWFRNSWVQRAPKQFIEWILDFLFYDTALLPLQSRAQIFKKLNTMLEMYFPPVYLDMPESASAVVQALRIIRKGSVGDREVNKTVNRYSAYRIGYKQKFIGACMRRVHVFKDALKKIMPLPAASAQIYLDEAVERIRIEQEVSDAIRIFDWHQTHGIIEKHNNQIDEAALL